MASDPPDTYDVTTWEARSALDRFAVRAYGVLGDHWGALAIVLAAFLLVVQFALVALVVVTDPFIALFLVLSIVPAALLAGYIYRTDPTDREPLGALAVTFILGGLFANFAAFVDSVPGGVLEAIPIVGPLLFFFIFVGPVEETVKWLAIRAYAVPRGDVDFVIDGAVYGAMAGLGFATIENGIYIVNGVMQAAQAGHPIFSATLGAAAVRSLAGPGHVIYSAFAGYYLGLAVKNRENYGPIAVKGLTIAAVIHALYDTLVTYLPDVIPFTLPVFLGFVVVFDGFFLAVLFRKLRRYRRVTEELDDVGKPRRRKTSH